jgi:metal-responsive CopG/Arc/MetJ family transcriptional regulator
MKAVQVMLDEDLLAALDGDAEVQATGRSAAIREAIGQWLRARRQASVDRAYQRGYARSPGLGSDWKGWEQEGEWPDE